MRGSGLTVDMRCMSAHIWYIRWTRWISIGLGRTGTYQKKARQKSGGSHTLSDWILSSAPKGEMGVSVGRPIMDMTAALIFSCLPFPERHYGAIGASGQVAM